MVKRYIYFGKFIFLSKLQMFSEQYSPDPRLPSEMESSRQRAYKRTLLNFKSLQVRTFEHFNLKNK